MESRFCDSDHFIWIKPPARGNNMVVSFFLQNSLCYDAYKLLLTGFGAERWWCAVTSPFCLNSIHSASSASHSSPALSICFLPTCHTSTSVPWHKAAAQLHFPAQRTGFPTNRKLTTTDLSQLWILNCLLRTYRTKAIKNPKQIHCPRQMKNKMKIHYWNKVSPCMFVCPGEKTWNEDDRHLLHRSVHYLHVLRWYEDELDDSRAD